MADAVPTECTICTEAFDSDRRIPRNLPCGHTYCEVCCDDILRQHKGSLHCPSGCATYRYAKANKIPKNYALLHVLSALASPAGGGGAGADAKQAAAVCGNCEETPATVHCAKCEGDLCDACFADIHKKGIYRTHQSIPLSAKPKPVARCAEHQERLSIWCDKCKHTICLLCKEEGSAHFGHPTKIAGAVVASSREELQQRIAALTAVANQLEQRERKVALATQAVTDSEQAARRAVAAAADRLVAAVRSRQAELDSSISAEAKRLQAECKQAFTAAQQPKATATAACEAARKLTAAADADLLQHVGAMNAQLARLEADGKAVLASPLALRSVSYSLPSPDSLLREIARFGGVGVPGVVTALAVTRYGRAASVEWKAPLSSGLPMTGYEVAYARLGEAKAEGKAEAKGGADGRAKPGKGAGGAPAQALPEGLEWIALPELRGNVLTASLPDLEPASRYGVRVRAVNAAGPGLWETVQFETEEKRGFQWKLATGAPGVCAPVERLSDLSARQNGANNTYGFIQGDTPLSSGVHAWRVRVDGLNSHGNDALLGVVQAGKMLRADSYNDPSFHGIQTHGKGSRNAAGKWASDSGFEEIRSGDTLDFLLNVDAGTLTVTTLKDGKRCAFTLPRYTAWVPHFFLGFSGNIITVE